MAFQVEQSVPICLALSAFGGAIEVFATAVLAYQDAKAKEGTKCSTMARYAALAVNIFLQVLSSLVGNLFATWFGPVSLVGPVFLSSQLLANMVVFGMILGLEMFTKDMKVGTYVVVLAVILLPIVGPAAQEDQDVAALFGRWYAMLWASLQVAGMTVSAILLVVLDLSNVQEWKAIAVLLSARATAFTINLTVSKVMIMDIGNIALGLAIVLKLISGSVITFALVVQSTAVTQAKFVPLNASALIVVNAVTGMILWQDWHVVGNWVGYVCVFVQLVLGNYLLLGDVEMLSAENARCGRVKAIEMTKSLKRVVAGDLHGRSQEVVLSDGIDHTADTCTPGDQYLRFEPKSALEDGDIPRRHRPQARRIAARQEAWSSIYGIDRAGGPRRRTSIFVLDTAAAESFE